MDRDKYYITTPIFYSNDVPHIGHTGTTIFADIIARYQRLLGKEVLFTSGTDEHGEKVAESAAKAGKAPQEFVDDMAVRWQEYWKQLNVSSDLFVRTTDPKHKEIVSELLTKLYENKYIYKGIYKGVYCVGCEEYKTERQLVDGKCPEHRPDQITIREEENYKFKLSELAPVIKKKIESNEILVTPENKRQEMLSRLSDDIEDLSMSRPNVEWGIKVPWDDKHTVYVWVEALMNYYTSLFRLNKKEFWPADVHFVGKGINWFHSVIWPAMLHALEIEPPKQIFAHSHYNVDGQKVGKSLGNAISPETLIERYGVDGTRYLLASTIPYENDSDVSFKLFDEKYNADLANGLGNLVSRVAKLAENLEIEVSSESKDSAKVNLSDLEVFIKEFKLHQITDYIKSKITDANMFLNDKAPWSNADKDAAKKDVEEVIKQILNIAYLASPIFVEDCAKILQIFSGKIKASKPLFVKIDK